MKRYSKDELRKEYEKTLKKKRQLDGEIARQNLHEGDNSNKEKKRVELEKRLEEIQRELGNNDLM